MSTTLPVWFEATVERVYADVLAEPRKPSWRRDLARQLELVTYVAESWLEAERNAALLRGHLGLT